MKVTWYELVPGQRGSNVCYNGKYRPRSQIQDEISAVSVLVNFGSLTLAGTIPDMVQRFTRECLDPFGENEENEDGEIHSQEVSPL